MSEENWDPSVGYESDIYAHNRERPESKKCKEINIEHFSLEDEEQDFSTWICQFEDAVSRHLNPHSQHRHHQECLRWLPSVLKTEAYAVWSRAENRKTNWKKLKSELESAFDDGNLQSEWKSNLKAYPWDEDKQSLQNYCARVKCLVDKYEKGMANCPAARKAHYFLRFVNGLPDDYVEHIKLSLSPKCNDVDKARDVCIQFQSVKRSRAQWWTGTNGMSPDQ